MFDAVRARVPVPVLAQMAWNLLLDAVLGLAPLVGDVADVAHRANVRNYRLLEKAVTTNPDPGPPTVGYIIAALALTVLPLLVLTIAIPYRLLNDAGFVGCASQEEMTAFWAKPAAEVTDDEREAEIRRQKRCVDFEGMTRTQVMEQLGEWTSVKEYPRTAAAHKGPYHVWSNGSDTKGIGIEFESPRGPAVKVETYEP